MLNLSAIRRIDPKAGFPESAGWRWPLKARGLGPGTYSFIGIRWERVFQGLMLVNLEPWPSVLSPGEGLLYVEYIETAPWNQTAYEGQGRRFAAIGTELLRAAVQNSIEIGCDSRIGLHSLPQSRDLLSQMFEDIGIDQKENLRYFERNGAQAHLLLRGDPR